MKLKDFIEKQAGKISSLDAAKLATELAKLPDLDLDDEVVGAIDGALITESEAENRPTIKSKFTAQALNGVDALLNPVLSEFFDETEIAALDKSTTKRLAKLIDKAKGLKSSGATPDEAAKTIRELNELVTKTKADSDTEISSLKSQFQRERYFDKLATKVLGRGDVTDKAKAKEARFVLSDFNDTLDSLGGVIDVTTGKIVKKDDPTLELFVGNKAVTVDSVLEKTLKDNDWLKVSDPRNESTVTVENKQKQAEGENPAQRKMRETTERRAAANAGG